MRLESEEARGPGALHNKFAEWFGEGIPESAWEKILEDDKYMITNNYNSALTYLPNLTFGSVVFMTYVIQKCMNTLISF